MPNVISHFDFYADSAVNEILRCRVLGVFLLTVMRLFVVIL